MKVARLFDGIDESGAPYFSAGRARIDDLDERARVRSFLRGGKLVLRTTGRLVDQLDQSRGKVVPLSFRTDGHWVWSDGVDYYVAEHGVAPEAEFLRYIKASRYSAQVPDDAAVADALAAIKNRRR